MLLQVIFYKVCTMLQAPCQKQQRHYITESNWLDKEHSIYALSNVLNKEQSIYDTPSTMLNKKQSIYDAPSYELKKEQTLLCSQQCA